ncbi:hypothetical protein ACQ4M3_42125 [Leptolyngbya sp. AN03gr2]|uniref:hypothetical protein n=1 Tax=unclassified Leptolyngbya TaxID=2650499 RepID=UPI003D31F2CD
MLRNSSLKQWNRVVSAQFPHLSLSQVTGLSLWSFGIALTQSSSLSRVSQSIARLNAERPNTVRQRLKEWYEEASYGATIVLAQPTITLPTSNFLN